MSLRYVFFNTDFKKIPGYAFDYWVSKNALSNFKRLAYQTIDCRTGLICGSNEKYVRSWNEINFSEIKFDSCDLADFGDEHVKWAPYNHGGSRRKWYGSHYDVVNFQNKAEMIRKEKGAMLRNERFYFKEGITWNRVGSGNNFAARKAVGGFAFDDVSPCGFVYDGQSIASSLAYLNSKVFGFYLRLFSNGFKVEIGQVKNCPFLEADESKMKDIDELAVKCISEETKDWDSFETSWDFKKHPLI